jgi:hypothetical protein
LAFIFVRQSSAEIATYTRHLPATKTTEDDAQDTVRVQATVYKHLVLRAPSCRQP